MKKTGTALTVASVAAAITLIGFAAASCDEKKDVSQKSSEASIVTNDNGSVARTYVESTVTTNGNMVTERRRETRTTLDADGNICRDGRRVKMRSRESRGGLPRP